MMEHVKHFPGFIGGEYHDRLVERLRSLAEFAQVHSMKHAQAGVVAVLRRPKLVFGVFVNGVTGLYFWNQVEASYVLIEPMPGFGHELISFCKAKIPEMVEVDSMLLTFSDGIPPHHDKRFNSAGPEKSTSPLAQSSCCPLVLPASSC